MNLIELVERITQPRGVDNILAGLSQNKQSEAFLVYLQKPLGVESEVTFFPIEETEDSLLYQKSGREYLQLFPLEYALELIESDLDLLGKGRNSHQIADRLLQYRINDA